MSALEEAKKIIKTLIDKGYEAYIVGGYVRDHLLGLDSYDIDITTSADVCDLMKIFKIEDNGSKYDSVTINVGDYKFEITSFRRDIAYLDHRHPIVERAKTLDEDLDRRDYTINAIAMDIDGNIIDKYHGIDDLNNKTIKLIGNPFKRYDEDALRILRGLYLVSKLGFDIDKDTFEAMKKDGILLSFISNYRKRLEISKIIKYNKNNQALNIIKESGIYKNLGTMGEAIYSLSNNNILINDDLLFYVYAFNSKANELKDYEFEKEYRKRIENIIKLSQNMLDAYTMLDKEYDDISYANSARRLLNKEYIIDIKDYYSNLKIHSIHDINIKANDIKKYLPSEKISKIQKDLALDILNGKIKNDYECIVNYLEKRKLNG